MASERSKATKAKPDMPAPTEPKETNSITFEWPLRGLKQMFDSSKSDTKSKVIKSVPFGGGRWTVLFYAQSGHDQFCSLYLNAEPLPHERQSPLLGCVAPSVDGGDKHRDATHGSGRRGSGTKGERNIEDEWTRSGLFRFTFNIQTLEDKTTLGTKEAHDHAFSHRTSNWGWAQFAKRDHVYYKNSDAIREDAFLITVTITASSERPKSAESPTLSVPPVLVQAMGSLLDDPEHSDVVFHLVPSKRRGGARRGGARKVFAIRKVLSARSEYFRLMFESGFQEAELEDSSDEDGSAAPRRREHRHSPAHPHRAHHDAARAKQLTSQRPGLRADTDNDAVSEDDSDMQDVVFEDSDEDYDLTDIISANSVSMSHRVFSKGAKPLSGYNSPDGDEDGDVELRSVNGEEPAESVPSAGRQGTTRTSRQSVKVEPVLQDREFDHATADLEEKAAKRRSMATDEGSNNSSSSTMRSSRPHSPNEGYMDASSHSREPSTNTSSPGMLSKASKREQMKQLEPRSSRSNLQILAAPDRRKRRKVTVMDSAYPTFKALLYFLYTDTVEFAPLTSSFLPAHVAPDDGADVSLFSASRGAVDSGSRTQSDHTSGSFTQEMHNAHRKRKAVIAAYQEKNPDRPAPCSAKAMYRLADKLDIPDLKRRAQEHISLSLTTNNIVWEVFSGFNTQYPDIRKMETDFLLKHWPEVKRSSAMKSIFWRSSAHPGLAEVWPHLLEYLEYKQPDVASETVEAGF